MPKDASLHGSWAKLHDFVISILNHQLTVISEKGLHPEIYKEALAEAENSLDLTTLGVSDEAFRGTVQSGKTWHTYG